MKIHRKKISPLVQESIMAFTCPGSGNAITVTKSEAQPEVLIDGINIFNKETKSSGMSDLTEYYGRTVNYSVLPPRNTKSEDGMLSQTKLYIPKLLCIETPSVTTEDEEYPLCFYKDFVLGWNRDEKNVNGVMVAIEWNGSMVFGESNTNAFIRNTDFFEDTGSVTIPEAMFEGIPDTALCRLTILRGDLDNIVADGSSYKVYGETHAVLPFVLIREIRKIN